ncbi:MAG: DMT family transporter [Lachnospiraceae bacterium]|nr:DMT family transporter [Lachnospiraceae bacterium]MBQ8261722.1 DMT family transporter [Lachnospiraceae bacterium]MBQ8263074.1 DMT family transporter [Lachnospiraceae bacterium]
MWGIIIAIISGILMSVQGVFNTQVTKVSGIWTSAAFVQASALVVCLVVWAFAERENLLSVFQVSPKYMLLGGVIGAFITITVIKSMELLGPAKAVMLIVTAQIIMAYVIELLGIWGADKQPLEWRRLLGVAITIAGIIIFKF